MTTPRTTLVTDYTIRSFQATEREYTAAVAIYNQAWPDERPITVAMMRENDETWPADAFQRRLVVENEGEIVAVGACYEAFWQHQPDLIHLDFNTHPAHANQGVNERLYAALVEVVFAQRPQTHTLATNAREDKTAHGQFLQSEGYQPVMRSPKSSLMVADFDETRFQGIAHQVADQGIQIYTLQALMADEPEWKEKLRALRWAIHQDVPAVEPPQEPSMAEFEQMVLDDPALDPEAWFVAVQPGQGSGVGRFVGQSNLWINDPTYQRLDTGLTGTIRGYRRRGIATALKLCTIAFARRKGAHSIDTSNEENNPMYAINLRLGFQPKPVWISYRKIVNP
ncbi:MAG: GNAT family N-acetyltransferase [Caldilinea sp. CFX5]|nr:GNAT family N-acetyltransferase [Caldilinea sp. CFX5]